VTTEPQYEETLGGRLAKAAEFIGSIEKDGYNKFHDYEYVTEAAVKRAVGPALRAAGLYISSVSHVILSQSTPTAVLCETSVVVGMIGTLEGSFAIGKSIGSGSDKGDKAAYKAMAGGLKYALTSLFLIPTPDEDAEYDGGKKEPKAAKPAAEPKPEPKPKAAKEPKAAKPQRNRRRTRPRSTRRPAPTRPSKRWPKFRPASVRPSSRRRRATSRSSRPSWSPRTTRRSVTRSRHE
jgi:hypothetical protein